MKRTITFFLALLTVSVFAAMNFADSAKEEGTYEGKLVCAKCSLQEEGREKCQNVLLVEGDGSKTLFYLAKTEAADDFGHVCLEEKKVRVTGSVEEKEGKKWLAATEITVMKSEG